MIPLTSHYPLHHYCHPWTICIITHSLTWPVLPLSIICHESPMCVKERNSIEINYIKPTTHHLHHLNLKCVLNPNWPFSCVYCCVTICVCLSNESSLSNCRSGVSLIIRLRLMTTQEQLSHHLKSPSGNTLWLYIKELRGNIISRTLCRIFQWPGFTYSVVQRKCFTQFSNKKVNPKSN